MKNAATGIGLAVLGLGIAVNGLNINGNTANATPAAFNAGPGEPTIVWYDLLGDAGGNKSVFSADFLLVRAWSDGTVEARSYFLDGSNDSTSYCETGNNSQCPDTQGWFVISSPNEGLNAAADINFDERVDAADLGLLVAAWGDAPRNDHPPSDCPLGLIP